jgi:hypothetical protein
MTRPYFTKSLADLEQIFASCGGDKTTLKELQTELEHRDRPAAKRLLAAVELRMTTSDSDDNSASEPELAGQAQDRPRKARLETDSRVASAKPRGNLNGELFGTETESLGNQPDDRERPQQLSRIRPPGTKNLPDAYEHKRSRELALTLPEDAMLPDIYIAALGELIREIKRTSSGQKRYELENGHRTESVGDDTLYSFPFADEAELFEEAQVEVLTDGKRIQAIIVSISAGRLLLGLKDDVGQAIPNAVLLMDTTALLAALKEKIEKVKAGELILNRTLADAVVGKAAWPPAKLESVPLPEGRRLNRSQQVACDRALADPVAFIWGPPGCGKTETLSEIVRATLKTNKRLLVCSNTNRAVDQVLYKLCKALGPSNEGMQAGHILRLGRVADDKLKNEFGEFVTLEGVVARLAVELESRKKKLEDDIAREDARMEPARQIIALFDAFSRAETRFAAALIATNKADVDLRIVEEESAAANRRKIELYSELESRRKAVLTFLRRSEETIQEDIRLLLVKIDHLQRRTTETSAAHALAYQELRSSERECADHRHLTAGKDKAKAQAVVDKSTEARATLLSELREVVAKIAALREEALRRAKVIGATCTKSYLSHGDIGQVDVVVIDEASMVMQPVAWFAAGLARERVVISGDFRQIPPIVPTNQEAVHEVLGRDAFDASGFLHLNDARLLMLDTQYRMTGAICELIAAPMYGGKLHTAKDREAVKGLEPPEPFRHHLTIIDTSDLWPFEGQTALLSRFNMLHALLARNLAWYFHTQGAIGSERDFGICTPYAAQSRMIEKLLEGEGLDEIARVGTVHRYQGDERRIMLLDVPESHGGAWGLGQFVQGVPPKHVGARLINVAVSRAQEHLIVMANLTYLDKRLPSTSLLREILHKMQEVGRVVPGADVLKLRPIARDLEGLIGQMDFNEVVKNLAVFDESQFERGLIHDIQNAKQSVVIFSGYITPARVGKMAELLRAKVMQGVKVRCVTRPPRNNGSIPEAAGRQAIALLEGIGVVVDCRARIHQKICLIDSRIVWLGSLNTLSHMYQSDETMTRAVNAGFASIVAVHMSKRTLSLDRALASIADAENPRCLSCKSRTVLSDGRHGAFFLCEAECGWSQSVKHGQATSQATSDLKSSGPPCPVCRKETRLRHGAFGAFYGCTGFPECKGIAKPTKNKRAAKAKRASKVRA